MSLKLYTIYACPNHIEEIILSSDEDAKNYSTEY